ncbi:ESX-1 secreted protein, EspB [Mycobacterium lentiflavum]|uniref:ESX-1 secreted protein, EspB n=1 Tax=Mycobacterium lentiflavum TaxID=141349 RepID=A0A0E4H2C4_MYCLN|nr:hypothetical protein [Mycobacterium lentiflavum]ULP40891.1 hypothetical protein MJO58_18455 [Mycobacterium lentiflavum]CQD17195.1 ESX-1 secreted protein, EspB [Mycobacterium lentiflavum]
MTQPLTVNVEKQELLARANELEQLIPGLPSELQALQAPCNLAPIVAAAEQLVLSANNMRIYLAVGEKERANLAETLRNAADAYEDADEGAAQALRDGTSVSNRPVQHADQAVDRASLKDTRLAADPLPGEFQAVKQRAFDLEQPDQGAAFLAFADAWAAHRVALLQAVVRFRPFTEWSGPACSAVEANFDQQRSWLTGMAELCNQLVTQAHAVVDAHRWMRGAHIVFPDLNPAGGDYVLDYAEILRCEETWERIWDDPAQAAYKQSYIEFFQKAQEKSDELVAQYQQKANLPLAPINPPTPPAATAIQPPSDDNLPDGGGSLYPDGSAADAPAGVPSVPSIPSLPMGASPKTPAQPGPALAGSKDTKVPGLPKAGAPGLKPASVGLGGPAMPSAPLQDPHYTTASPGAAAKGPEGPGLAVPGRGAGGAMGGGGMGAAPLGAQGDRGAGKGKRLQQDDDAIYTENRAWTEGIIGRLPAAKSAADQKGQKP